MSLKCHILRPSLILSAFVITSHKVKFPLLLHYMSTVNSARRTEAVNVKYIWLCVWQPSVVVPRCVLGSISCHLFCWTFLTLLSKCAKVCHIAIVLSIVGLGLVEI